MTQQRKLEDYLKMIYLLQRKGTVCGADIAEELNVKRTTVSVSLKELEQEGDLIRLGDRSVILTPQGAVIAREVADRNKGIYELYIAHGISEEVAMRDACNMEHTLSQESFCALISLGECVLNAASSPNQEESFLTGEYICRVKALAHSHESVEDPPVILAKG